ncbi:MAG: dephospho-CoA kinase [Myxococcota bacterium]|nr:dephospho-CoA kinase [Myxococcota bacterium]
MTKIFGLTGGIGSGKSTVAGIFQEMGAEIVDADQLARLAVAPGSFGLARIIETFGSEIILEDGTLDRPALGKLVFSDASKRQQLNAIVHPEVQRLAQEAFQRLIDKKVSVVLYDVPLLYESKLESLFLAVVVVYVPPELQIQRVMKRDHLEKHEVEQRLAAQMSLDLKAEKADYLIDNSHTLEETRSQVRKVWDNWKSEE